MSLEIFLGFILQLPPWQPIWSKTGQFHPVSCSRDLSHPDCWSLRSWQGLLGSWACTTWKRCGVALSFEDSSEAHFIRLLRRSLKIKHEYLSGVQLNESLTSFPSFCLISPSRLFFGTTSQINYYMHAFVLGYVSRRTKTNGEVTLSDR